MRGRRGAASERDPLVGASIDMPAACRVRYPQWHLRGFPHASLRSCTPPDEKPRRSAVCSGWSSWRWMLADSQMVRKGAEPSAGKALSCAFGQSNTFACPLKLPPDGTRQGTRAKPHALHTLTSATAVATPEPAVNAIRKPHAKPIQLKKVPGADQADQQREPEDDEHDQLPKGPWTASPPPGWGV